LELHHRRYPLATQARLFGDASSYVEQMARGYRRDLWQSQNVRTEIWLEKDALEDVIFDVTYRWDVSLMVSRGQSSAAFLHAAAQQAQVAWHDHGVETIIYTLYDFDAGGERSARTIARDLPKLAPEVPITVVRLAVTQSQIETWHLPTRPAKKSDPEAAKFGDKAVELDAIDPDTLSTLVDTAIRSHVDDHLWRIEGTVENEERAGLLAISQDWSSR
jgi:hypothetical protein